MEYQKPKRIFLKSHPDYQERWVQDRIAADPGILGLGDLVLRDSERSQPRAGRLDLLLQDPESKRRYEVEIQLGPTDETHIIRTIEYWDIERKRYPQYDHAAVLVAEDITSRFLNVVSLFNGTIPLIALQLQAFEVGEHMTLIVTKVLDEMTRGLVDEDEIEESAQTDRGYWESKRATKETVQLVDRCFDIVRELDPDLELNYNKFYIGLASIEYGRLCNFVTFIPQKAVMQIRLRLESSSQIDSLIEESGFDTLEYYWGDYRIRLKKSDLEKHMDVLRDLIGRAFNEWNR